MLQITVKERIPIEAFLLDEAEVDAVKYIPVDDLAAAYRRQDPTLVPVDMDSDVRPFLHDHCTLSHRSFADTFSPTFGRWCCSSPRGTVADALAGVVRCPISVQLRMA